MITCAMFSLMLATTTTTLPELTSPLTITSVQWYRDGGTTSVDIVDANGVTIVGGFGVDLYAGEYPIFVHAQHFREAGAVIFAADSAAASLFVSLVRRALAETLGADEMARLREAAREDLPRDHRIRDLWRLLGIVDGWQDPSSRPGTRSIDLDRVLPNRRTSLQ